VDIVLRAAVAYAFMIFLLRIIGRRELPTLAPSDLVLLVVMGDLVQNGVTQSDQSVTGVLLALQMAGVGFRKPSARQAEIEFVRSRVTNVRAMRCVSRLWAPRLRARP
jgi:uncharacterized membrane protein YcaP (DUF421 family)